MFSWIKKLARIKPQRESSASQEKQYMKHGFELFGAGNHSAAQEVFHRILKEQPDNSDALYLLGVIELREGRNNEAITLIGRAIENDANVASYHFSMGSVHSALGNLAQAVASYRRAVNLDPMDADLRVALSRELVTKGDSISALEHLTAAINLSPENVQIRYNLGVILQSLGRSTEAKDCYRDVLVMDPRNAQAENNLGAILHAEGSFGDAIKCFQNAVEVEPSFAQAWSNLGVAVQASGKVDEAEPYLERALSLDPRDFNALSNLALAQREKGLVEKSQKSSRLALEVHDNFGERIRLATLLPVVAKSTGQIKEWRSHFSQAVAELVAQGGYIRDPLREVNTCNFNLAYQPDCDKILQEQVAQLHIAACPSLEYSAQHCKDQMPRSKARIKVGFISKFMHEHSIGKTTRGLLKNISRDRFHVTALFAPPLVDDSISVFIRESADEYLLLPPTLEAAREAIASLELDILFYQDIGMDAYTYFLAFSRLAPVQCVSFGHPDTTGIPNMDYWVSSENFETEGALSHYSEKLFLLRNIGTLAYYYRPALSQPLKVRSDFGLAEEGHIYLCPQSLFKIHPDFDAMIAGILRSDMQGVVVLIESRIRAWTEQLRQRFQDSIPDVMDRIQFQPPLKSDDFLALIALSDVMLDTFYFNGMNTSLEAFAVGTPVVTMPSTMQRGRHTYGMYKHMGITDCIATSLEQYIDISLRLGTDKNIRAQVKENILSRSMVLYEDVGVVREFERFFFEAHAHAHAQERRALLTTISQLQDDGHEALFLVSSAIHVQHGVFSSEQRLAQTIITCESIKKKCPASRIILLEGGVEKLSAHELRSLDPYVWRIESFTEEETVIETRQALSQDVVKNAIEIYMYKTFFEKFIKNEPLLVANFSRIFKVSGRYSLNDEFDYRLHSRAGQRVVICGPHNSQFNSDITGGIRSQYMSRLWSFDISLLPKISKCYEAMWVDFSARLSRAGYADIEHLLFHHLDPADVLSVKRIGIQGAIAPTGTLVAD